MIDHLSAAVVEKFIKEVAEPELKACGPNPPYAIFCDSLEVNGENWTDEMLAEFQKRRGYDLKPHLPALVGNFGADTAAVRHDWAETVTDVFNENFNARLQKLAKQYGTRFRIQGYGYPPAGLYSYAFADLPEGEGGREWELADVSHNAVCGIGEPFDGAEGDVVRDVYVAASSGSFRATPLDMKGEADTHFLDGINQLICHGWPYTPAGVGYPGASFYAAAVFDEKNPWYVAMPEITGYMQQVSQILREGTPANDIAVYLPDSDVWSHAEMGYSSMNAAFTENSGVLAALVDAGYNIDGWDDGMLRMKGKVEGGALVFGDVRYKVVVLGNAEFMPLATARALKTFAEGGGLVVAIGRVPGKVPGLKATEQEQAELIDIVKELFSDPEPKGVIVPTNALAVAEIGRRVAQMWRWTSAGR